MALDPVIAQGVTPIGAGLPNTMLALQQMRSAQQENVLRNLQIQSAQLGLNRSNMLYKAQQDAIDSGDPSKYENTLAMADPKAYGEYQAGKKTAQEVSQAQLAQHVRPLMNMAATIMNAKNPAVVLQNAPPEVGQFMSQTHPGADLTDDNQVRQLAAAYYDHFGGMIGEKPAELPVPLDTVQGAAGSLYNRQPVTGALTQVTAPSYPTMTLEKGTNAAGKQWLLPFQTGGYRGGGGSNALLAPPGASPGAGPPATTPRGSSPAVSPRAGSTVPRGASPAVAGAPQSSATDIPAGAMDVGYATPSEPQAKAATFAGMMRGGMNKAQQMEDAGFRLSPKDRAIIQHAATSEDTSLAPEAVTNYLLSNGLSKGAATYMAAILPMLQAQSHSLSGARVTLSQLLQGFESLVPTDSKDAGYMDQIRNTRNGMYRGLLLQAGPGAYAPEFKNSLGADRDSIARNDTFSTAPLSVGQARSFNGVTVRRVR